MYYDIAFLLLRLVIGGTIAAHGAQKLFGWWSGPGWAGFVKASGERMRLRPALWWALMAVLSEVGGGVLLVLGFLSPLGALGVSAAMLMAILLAHWPRFWNSQHGMEYPLALLAGGLALGLTGPGAYSLDALLGLALPAPATFLLGLVLVVVGVAVALLTRAPQPAPAPAAEAVSSSATR
jgi:putative oxidoreductase